MVSSPGPPLSVSAPCAAHEQVITAAAAQAVVGHRPPYMVSSRTQTGNGLAITRAGKLVGILRTLNVRSLAGRAAHPPLVTESVYPPVLSAPGLPS